MSGYLQLADGRTVPVRDGLVIGRVAGCDVVIEDTKASRKHAKVVVEAGVVEVLDLDSSNGTLLNGKPVTRRVLRDGDQVQIGKTVLTFREGAHPAGPSLAAAPLPDDNDLFGDGPPAKPATPPPPAAQPGRREEAAPRAATVPPAAPPAGPVPPAAPRPTVVEFADEVVEVRKAPAAEASKPAAGSPASPVIAASSRVLQFHKQEGGGGLLGDDLAQMSTGTRAAVYAVVLAVAAGVVYGIVHLIR